MNTPHSPSQSDDHMGGPVTPEKIRRFRAHVAAVHDHMRERDIDPTRLPDPVEELVKARDAGGWE